MFPSPQRVAVFLNISSSDQMSQDEIDMYLRKAQSFADDMYAWLISFYHNDPDTEVLEPLVGIIHDAGGDPRRPGYAGTQVSQFIADNPDIDTYFTHYHVANAKRIHSTPSSAGGYGTVSSSVSF